MNRSWRRLRRTACLSGAALALAILPARAEGTALDRVAGYVDASAFAALAGPQATKVEVTLQGPLLKAVAKMDPELTKLVSGLEAIHAVVLELEEGTSVKELDRLASALDGTGTALVRKGWMKLAEIREPGGAQVQVLALESGETIRGLVVLVIDRGERQAVFANIAGLIDLASLQEMGEQLSIPGLGSIPSGVRTKPVD